MAAALYDPESGYYCRERQRWGREGDYRTSPERTRLFGATFARYFAKLFQTLGAPERWSLVECGAGSGEFVVALLETLQRDHEPLFKATRLKIDEISPYSQTLITNRLGPLMAGVEFVPVEKMDPIEVGVVFANELLDAFPVHRVMQHQGKLWELYVGLNDESKAELQRGPLSTPRLADYFAQEGIPLLEGQQAEVNLEIEIWLKRIAEKLNRGFLILVDYGEEAGDLYNPMKRPKGSLRAFERHQFREDFLEKAGEVDLTTTVNWDLVRRLATALGFEVIDAERQDRFLLKIGLLPTLERLVSRRVDEGEAAKLRAEAREMILPSGMAASFQVMVLRTGPC
jgi:SAM-dependent MidA family methyltransferase